MALLSVSIEDFRCLKQAHLELDARSTLISGLNASGKSSLLEAIFLLGRGRSFRTSQLNSAIRYTADRLRVVGQIAHRNRTLTVGVEVSADGISAHIGGEVAPSLAALSTAFPVQVIEPGIHKLIEEGPVRRRRFLDWGVFHVEPSYLEHWQRFNRVLRQRNAALQSHSSDAVLDAWDVEFVEAGEKISAARLSYLEAVRPYLSAAIDALLQETIEIDYRTGWLEGRSLAQALIDSRRHDRLRRTSTAGPHRADLVFRAAAGPAKQVISRGQQKLLATSAVLGQLAYHIETSDLQPTLLLDDPAAELDTQRLQLLLSQVEKLGIQLITTSLRRDFNALGIPGRRFHVEHGQVTPLYSRPLFCGPTGFNHD